ncbi:MAG: energy-coupling factor transporter ATPase [Clostridia bacterium]|nr:energy-coupling factor transporter ATPase [Clostridia bacterium]
MALLELKNVCFSYDKQSPVIKDVSFEVQKGEYVAVIGHNGSGKSTIARLINALLKPESGSITVDGFSACDKKSVFEIRKRVGVVFQNPDNQMVASIVEDDVAFGPENLGVPRDEIAKRIDFALDAVGMQDFRKSAPERLSGGQKQRIAIAGVLALAPKIIILDESTAMLDPAGRKDVLRVVKKLNKEQGVTVIAITHYMEEVISADRVIVINDGTIETIGTPKEIFAKAKRLKEIGLELPTASYLANKLIEKGFRLPADVLSDEDLEEALCKL